MMKVSFNRTIPAFLYDDDKKCKSEYRSSNNQPLLLATTAATAVVASIYYDDSNNSSNKRTTTATTSLEQVLMVKWKIKSLWIGILFGIFFQSCSIILKSYISIMYHSVHYHVSIQENTYLSVIWSLVACIMSIMALDKLRTIISNDYYCCVKTNNNNNKVEELEDICINNNNMNEFMLSIECQFVTGSVTGLCGAWIVADTILGLQSADWFHSVFFLVISFFSSCTVTSSLWSFSSSSSLDNDGTTTLDDNDLPSVV